MTIQVNYQPTEYRGYADVGTDGTKIELWTVAQTGELNDSAEDAYNEVVRENVRNI